MYLFILKETDIGGEGLDFEDCFCVEENGDNLETNIFFISGGGKGVQQNWNDQCLGYEVVFITGEKFRVLFEAIISSLDRIDGLFIHPEESSSHPDLGKVTATLVSLMPEQQWSEDRAKILEKSVGFTRQGGGDRFKVELLSCLSSPDSELASKVEMLPQVWRYLRTGYLMEDLFLQHVRLQELLAKQLKEEQRLEIVRKLRDFFKFKDGAFDNAVAKQLFTEVELRERAEKLWGVVEKDPSPLVKAPGDWESETRKIVDNFMASARKLVKQHSPQ